MKIKRLHIEGDPLRMNLFSRDEGTTFYALGCGMHDLTRARQDQARIAAGGIPPERTQSVGAAATAIMFEPPLEKGDAYAFAQSIASDLGVRNVWVLVVSTQPPTELAILNITR
jgi:hypothetical protein